MIIRVDGIHQDLQMIQTAGGGGDGVNDPPGDGAGGDGGRLQSHRQLLVVDGELEAVEELLEHPRHLGLPVDLAQVLLGQPRQQGDQVTLPVGGVVAGFPDGHQLFVPMTPTWTITQPPDVCF